MAKFEETMRELIAERGMGETEELIKRLDEAGRSDSARELEAVMAGQREVGAELPGDIVEALRLDPDQQDRLARAVAYGQGVRPAKTTDPPAATRPTPRASRE